MSKTEYRGKKIEVTVEDAKSYLISYLKKLDTVLERPYGYDVYLVNVIRDYAITNLAFDQYDIQGGCRELSHISPAFIDAAWELCVQRILRPGVKSTDGHGTTTPGYSVTDYGHLWITESQNKDYTPVESERFARIVSSFAPHFGAAFDERSQEAIRCYNNHTYLASCAMTGSSAETILIVTAEKLGATITRFDKPHDICKTIIKLTQASGKNISGLTERFSVYTDIIKYWRDAGMHHSKWDIDADRASFALDTLLSMCYFVKDKWFV